jgi:polyphosphate:AMP phosphotransferase
MFQSAEQPHEISKFDFKQQEAALREALLEAQFDLVERQAFPLLILLAGLDGAGKGAVLARLGAWLDPHHLHIVAFDRPTDVEKARPRMWRYWYNLPPRGKLGVFVGSWYREPLAAHVIGKRDENALVRELAAINRFEQMLAEEGVLLLKFWLHLSGGESKRRLREIAREEGVRHVVEQRGWKQTRSEIVTVGERIAMDTSTGLAPWVVVPSDNAYYRDLSVGRTILEAVRKRLAAAPVPATPSAPAPIPPLDGRTVLDGLDLESSLSPTDYRRQLAELQQRLGRMTDDRRFRKVGVVAVFEGNDAAGKGGSIRRVTMSIDPRRVRVHSIAAPTDEEKAQPYLWRFWRRLPGRGHVAVFDRSWYGRVLVERIEGFCADRDWLRAYGEINDFEADLTAHGLVIVKFWLAISKDEQLRRFKERENTPFKRYKITDEDWRNREKWDAYALAVNDMVDRTSTEHAPWTLVEAEDKRYARVKVLSTVCDRLEGVL